MSRKQDRHSQGREVRFSGAQSAGPSISEIRRNYARADESERDAEIERTVAEIRALAQERVDGERRQLRADLADIVALVLLERGVVYPGGRLRTADAIAAAVMAGFEVQRKRANEARARETGIPGGTGD